MNEDKNKQSAYSLLKKWLNDPLGKKVFGTDGLFGYQKEDHKVLEIFASYAYWETQDDGGIPITLDSEHFVSYVNSLHELSTEEKERISKKIDSLRREGAIKDKPLNGNTFRNFALLLRDLGIGNRPEMITMQYEDALAKAISFEMPVESGDQGSAKLEGSIEFGKKEYGETGISNIQASEISDGKVGGISHELREKSNLENKTASETDEKAEIELKDKNKTRIELEKKESSESEIEKPRHDQISTNVIPSSGPQAQPANRDKTQKEPTKETDQTPGPEDKKTDRVEEKLPKITRESARELIQAEPDKIKVVKSVAPAYQRITFLRKTDVADVRKTGTKSQLFVKPSKITAFESGLGMMRRATKSKTENRKPEKSDRNSSENVTASQFGDITLTPLDRRMGEKSANAATIHQSSVSSPARRLAKLAGAGVAGGSILPFFAGGSHTEAATFTANYLEKLLKFLF